MYTSQLDLGALLHSPHTELWQQKYRRKKNKLVKKTKKQKTRRRKHSLFIAPVTAFHATSVTNLPSLLRVASWRLKLSKATTNKSSDFFRCLQECWHWTQYILATKWCESTSLVHILNKEQPHKTQPITTYLTQELAVLRATSFWPAYLFVDFLDGDIIGQPENGPILTIFSWPSILIPKLIQGLGTLHCP